MAQIVSREQPRGTVTVAELLRRCAPAAELDHDDDKPIPVGALLRREGRRTGGLPRVPDQPPTATEAEEPAAESGRRLLVRRGALAAGALLTAGSVFGLATAMHSASELPQASGSYPGEGALDGVAADTPSTALDSGTPAPTSWMPVAFPTALGGATVAKLADAAQTATHAATPNVATRPADASTAGTSTHQVAGGAASTTGSGGGTVAETTKGLGDTVSTVGQNTPVAGVTSAVGSTVADVGSTLDSATTPVVSGVASAAKPVVGGVVAAATPVVGGVVAAAKPVVGGVVAVGKPVVGGVTAAATPVVSGVTAAAKPVVSAATSTVTGAATGAVTKTVAGLLG